MLDRSLNGLLGLRRVVAVDSYLFDGGPDLLHRVREAFAALLKSSHTDLLVDAQGMFGSGSSHLLAPSKTARCLGLPVVYQYSQALLYLGTRVDGHARDPVS